MNRIIRLSAVAALALITAGCGLRTRNFDDERAVTLNADCPDTLDLQVHLEYPVGRAPKEALEAMTESILSFVFDVDTVSGTVEETAGKYIEEISSGYINDLSNAWEQHLADKDEWKDWIYNWYIHVSGSFSKPHGSTRAFHSFLLISRRKSPGEAVPRSPAPALTGRPAQPSPSPTCSRRALRKPLEDCSQSTFRRLSRATLRPWIRCSTPRSCPTEASRLHPRVLHIIISHMK